MKEIIPSRLQHWKNLLEMEANSRVPSKLYMMDLRQCIAEAEALIDRRDEKLVIK